MGDPLLHRESEFDKEGKDWKFGLIVAVHAALNEEGVESGLNLGTHAEASGISEYVCLRSNSCRLFAAVGSKKSSESTGTARTLLYAAPHGGAAANGCKVVAVAVVLDL